MAENKFSIPPKKNKTSDENVFDFSRAGRAYPPKRNKDADLSYSWHAVSKSDNGAQPKEENAGLRPSEIVLAEKNMKDKFFEVPDVNVGKNGNFAAKDLKGQNFSKQKLEKENFSAADLTGADFSSANLSQVDFSGANLTDVNFSNADLSGAVLAGANLCRANFTGAKMNGVVLTEANLEEAILLGIDIDSLGIEELQALIEYMAVYYPHKLNLTKLNLTLLDLSKIDLTKVSLRGVDFTGCSMRGVKIWELDLSECIISPAQIAEALGHPPSAQELARLLAPKKPQKKKSKGIDVQDLFFDNGKEFGVWDVTKEKGLDIGKLVESGMKLFRKSAGKPQPSSQGKEIIEHMKEEKLRQDEDKARNEELKERILQRKEEERRKLAEKKQEFSNELKQNSSEKEDVQKPQENQKNSIIRENLIRRDRGRE